MRSSLLIVGTLALLIGLFFGYTMLQTSPVVVKPPTSLSDDPLIAPPDDPQTLIGSGESAWVEMRDQKWRVISRFRASRYDPRKDGRVHVADPQAVFFMSNGQRLRVSGRDGIVAMSRLPQPGENPRNLGSANQAPTRGELHDVRIDLFDSQQALDQDSPENPTQILRLTMDNAAFDNETARIFTSDTEIDSRAVSADRVPVVVTGRDYDFSGQGLTLRWNEKDRQLDFLEIAHGDRLVIKNPQVLQRTSISHQTREVSASALPVQFSASDSPTASGTAGNNRPAIQLAVADHSIAAGRAMGDAIAADQQQQTDVPQAAPAYRATFTENVRILRSQVETARADELFVDFNLGHARQALTNEKTATQPAAESTAAPAAAPATRAGAISPVPPSSPSADEPTTETQPITILWTGPLTVEILPENAPQPAAGAANIHMVGSPLQLFQETARLQARSMTYDTSAEQLSLDASDIYPLVMDDGKGATVESRSLLYSLPNRTVTFSGPSRALLPIRSATVAQSQVLSARWNQQCILHLADGRLESLVARRIELVGQVDVDHPLVKLKADRLDMLMDDGADPIDNAVPDHAQSPTAPSVERMQLKQLTATGQAWCQILNEQQVQQTISADQLMVSTQADTNGRLFVRQAQADGNVVASDSRQTFKAGHLIATLLPSSAAATDTDMVAGGKTPSPAKSVSPAALQRVDLEHFVAMDGAHYTSVDGKQASADQIEVLMTAGQPFITLLGNARVSDGANSLTGPQIQVASAEQKATIIGAGTLQVQGDAIQPDQASRNEQSADVHPSAQPVTVQWQQGVVVDGKANRIDVNKSVVITTAQADGTTHTIRGDQLVMLLQDAPADRAPKKSDQPDRPLLADKVVRSATLSGEVTVDSLRTGEKDEVLRRFILRGRVLVYDLLARTMTIDSPGRLLFEDHPSPAALAAHPDQDKLAGATAMRWDKRLVYEETAGTITMQGDVLINHEPEAGGHQSQPGFILQAQTVTAQMLPSTAALASKPSAVIVGDSSITPRQLQRFVAQDEVQFSSSGIDLEASQVQYEPAASLMIATGSDTRPVRISRGLSTGSFGMARYNLRTNQLQVTDFRGNVR
ncbi:MAG: hypothetical protein IT448_00170 [Phycisphaerales bacterium]|nr:hypothetical protein [Phycisphaerales bacterium]